MATVKEPLCKCNNCDNIWVDRNPQVNQKIFEVDKNHPSLVQIIDSFDVDSVEMYWGCPECRTDGNLSDFEGEIEIVYGKLIEKQ